MMIEELRRAWRLFRTNNRADTVAAVAILAVVAAPVVRSLWEVRKTSSRG